MAIANKLNSPLTGDRKLANKVGFAGDPDPVMVFVGGRPRVYLNWGPAKVSSLVQWLESDISGPWMLDSANTGDDRILNGGPGLDGGQAVDLDGASQYAVHADQSLAGDFTLTGWFKQDALGGVIWGRAHASKTEYIYHLGTTSMRLWFDGSDAIVNHGHTFSLGVWNHLTVRRSGTTISIFKNAVPPSTTGTQAAPFTASYIGRHRTGAYLNASFFDVRCYDRALTDDEISHVYSFGESGDDPGLDNRLYRYKSAESSGSTLYDSNGGSLNATLMNGPGYVSQAIKSFSNDEGYKGAMYFDGASDRSHSEITMDGDFTLSGWFYSIGSWGMLWSRLSVSNNYIWPLSTGTLRCQLNGTHVDITHGHTFPTDDWCHITVRRSGTTITVFLNAVAGGTTGTNGATWYMDGFGSYNGGSVYFDGMAHSQRAYSRALTDEEVTSLYNGEDVTGSEIYNLPGSQGKDTSGNNDNTLNGVSDHMIPRVSGDSGDVLGNSLDYTGTAPSHGQLSSPCGTFDGVDDFLDIPSLVGSETVTSSGGTSTPTISAGRIDFTAGTCWDLLLSNGDRYVFSEKDGTTIHNVTANARHATLTNASLASFWAATQTEFAWGCNNGYRLDGSTLIPAQVGGLVAADGNAITNPPGFNGASELDHDPYTIPKLDSGNLDGVTPPSAHALGDSVVDAAQHFIRQTATKEDRFLLYSEDLVEPNLSKANSYTA